MNRQPARILSAPLPVSATLSQGPKDLLAVTVKLRLCTSSGASAATSNVCPCSALRGRLCF